MHETLLKFLYLPLMSIPTKTPDVYEDVEVENNVAIPMRDGVKLYANIYKPKAASKFPVILIRLPYGKDEYYCYMPAVGNYWAKTDTYVLFRMLEENGALKASGILV